MELIIKPGGEVACIYSEDIDLRQFGTLQIQRASHVEPASDGTWTADMSPVSGPQLGPFSSRSLAIAAELQWLTSHLLAATASPIR